MNPVRPLRAVTVADAGRVGRKAAVLGELLAAGFPVPDGFVLSTDTDDMAEALTVVTEALGEEALAVRSSGVDEDLPDASYAGQYATVLDVRGRDALLAAVRTCQASALSEEVSAYRRARGLGGGPQLAVLVQRMVPAQAAGVAFSANPITGDRTEVMVSAVHGLGDRLAAGQVTPDEWVVRGRAPTRRSGPAQATTAEAITAEQAREVAELARRVAAYFGAPQDIEWALADGQLWLLQARPITALPVLAAIPIEVPPGFWQRDGYCPRPWSPMHRSLALPALRAALAHLFAYGVAEGLEFAEIGGWMYTRVVAPDTPARVRDRIERIVAAVRADEPGQTVRLWYEQWQPALTAHIAQRREVDLPSLTDAELAAHLRAVQELVEQVQDAHCRVGAAGAFLLGELGVAARDLLGWDVRRVLRLLTGLPGKTTEPAFGLADLAQRARATPAVARLLLQRVDQDTALLGDVDAEFARAFAAYQREYGHRALSPDLIDPTLAERPSLVLSLIRDQLARPFTTADHVAALQQERSAAVAEAHASLAAQPAAHRDRFERSLGRAQQAYPVREDSMFFWSAARALLRYAVLELGRRFAERGQLARPEDVFFLESDETAAALRDRADRRGVVARRAANRAWAQANPGPATYGTPAPAAGGWGAALPPEARHILDVTAWAWTATGAPPGLPRTDQSAGLALRGVAACPGRYTGPACVITDESGFDKLRPGDVLICPETTAAWSILFPSVGALVTDTGGLLSHPAIIAREYRVPAVLATGNATRLLRDGQLVTVDGYTGEVRAVG